MPATVPARWDVSKSHRGISRVEVWSQGVLVTVVDPLDPASGVISASVKEEFVTGLQRSLSMTVEPSYAWLTHARRPGLEIRPFSGLSWGTSEHLLPLGRFPILPPAISLPAQAVRIDGDDYWSWMMRAKRPAMSASSGEIRHVAAARFRVAGLPAPVVTATSNASVTRGVLWDAGSESDLVASLVSSIGATAFIDRDGVGRVQDRAEVVGPTLRDGENGTVISVVSTRDWEGIKNRYTVSSSNIDVKLRPQVVSVDDPDHPAYFANGLGWVDAEYSSPLFTTEAQMRKTARTLLVRDSRAARSWTVTAIPDPARMAGDKIALATKLGAVSAVIMSITHNLHGEAMQMTLGAT